MFIDFNNKQRYVLYKQDTRFKFYGFRCGFQVLSVSGDDCTLLAEQSTRQVLASY